MIGKYSSVYIRKTPRDCNMRLFPTLVYVGKIIMIMVGIGGNRCDGFIVPNRACLLVSGNGRNPILFHYI